MIKLYSTEVTVSLGTTAAKTPIRDYDCERAIALLERELVIAFRKIEKALEADLPGVDCMIEFAKME